MLSDKSLFQENKTSSNYFKQYGLIRHAETFNSLYVKYSSCNKQHVQKIAVLLKAAYEFTNAPVNLNMFYLLACTREAIEAWEQSTDNGHTAFMQDAMSYIFEALQHYFKILEAHPNRFQFLVPMDQSIRTELLAAIASVQDSLPKLSDEQESLTTGFGF